MSQIRQAELEEGDTVVRMIERMHAETKGLVKPGSKTLAYISESVWRALHGRGLALVAEDDAGFVVGALIAVDAEFPYDTNLGRTVLGLGTYVAPAWRKAGLASGLYTEARRLLAARGYDHYLGAHLVTNENAKRVIERVGFEPLEVTVLMHLGDR